MCGKLPLVVFHESVAVSVIAVPITIAVAVIRPIAVAVIASVVATAIMSPGVSVAVGDLFSGRIGLR